MKKKTHQKVKQYADQNPIEAILNVSGVVASDALRQIGIEKPKEPTKVGGDLTEGQELTLSDLKAMQEKQKKKEEVLQFLDIDPGLDYKHEILGNENQKREPHKLTQKVDEIILELKKIAQTSKELQTEFKEVIVEQRITKPGKYHLTFFSFILSLLRTAQQKVEEGGAWLNISKRKVEKQGYWAMFKKHGTSFGLSSERVVATQVG